MGVAVEFLLWMVTVAGAVEGGLVTSTCPEDQLVMYKMVFNTLWDKRDFPKQYPDWRPPAQWSKVIGKLSLMKYVLLKPKPCDNIKIEI